MGGGREVPSLGHCTAHGGERALQSCVLVAFVQQGGGCGVFVYMLRGVVTAGGLCAA